MGLTYRVGITSAISVWPPDIEPLPPPPYPGRGRVPVQPRRTPQRQPLAVKALAMALPARAFRTVRWREGSNQTLSSRFAAVRVRHAGGNVGRARLWPSQWLLIEWPKGQAEPEKYCLSTLPDKATLTERVQMAHRAGRSGTQAGVWSGSLRRARLARLSSPRQPEHCGLRIPRRRTSAQLQKKHCSTPSACRTRR